MHNLPSATHFICKCPVWRLSRDFNVLETAWQEADRGGRALWPPGWPWCRKQPFWDASNFIVNLPVKSPQPAVWCPREPSFVVPASE